jgi:hypothetical protein
MLTRLGLYLEDSAELVETTPTDFAYCHRRLIVVVELVQLYLGTYSEKIGCLSRTLGCHTGSRNARGNYGQNDQDHHNRKELEQYETTFTNHSSNSSEFRLLTYAQCAGTNHADFLCPSTQSIEYGFNVDKCGDSNIHRSRSPGLSVAACSE